MTQAVLRAALGDAAAWDQVGQSATLERLLAEEPDVLRLLPLVHRSFEAAGRDHPDLPAMADARRSAALMNGIRVAEAARLTTLLQGRGIEPVFLKGLPLVLGFYPSIDARYMADVDVLVPPPAVATTLDALRSAGWIMPADTATAYARRWKHSLGVGGPGGTDVDVHWALHGALRVPGGETAGDAKVRTESLTLGPARASTLTPALHVLHVCVHGALSRKPVWVADLAMLVRSGRVDWDELVEEAGRRQVVPIVRDCLHVATAIVPLDVPSAVQDALRSVRVTERRARELMVVFDGSPRGSAPKVAKLRWLWVREMLPYTRPQRALRFPVFALDQLRAREVREEQRAAARDASTPGGGPVARVAP